MGKRNNDGYLIPPAKYDQFGNIIPNTNPPKQARDSYFKRQVKRNGDRWFTKKNKDAIFRDLNQIMADICHGNLTIEDMDWFFAPQYCEMLRGAIYERYVHTFYRAEAINAYLNGNVTVQNLQINLNQQMKTLLQKDLDEALYWAKLQEVMTAFDNAVMTGGIEAGKQFFITSLQPIMQTLHNSLRYRW